MEGNNGRDFAVGLWGGSIFSRKTAYWNLLRRSYTFLKVSRWGKSVTQLDAKNVFGQKKRIKYDKPASNEEFPLAAKVLGRRKNSVVVWVESGSDGGINFRQLHMNKPRPEASAVTGTTLWGGGGKGSST